MRGYVLVAGLIVVAACLGSFTAGAQSRQKFDKGTFEAMQAAGKSILVHVSAPWCPTCKAQKIVLDLLTMKTEFKKLEVFEVDFDTGKQTLKEFNVRTQSTLILFKGKAETARSAGETETEAIEALLKTAL